MWHGEGIATSGHSAEIERRGECSFLEPLHTGNSATPAPDWMQADDMLAALATKRKPTEISSRTNNLITRVIEKAK